jgi:hypothetical protein
LRAELAELDVESVAPRWVKPLRMVRRVPTRWRFGAIVVALSASGGVFTALIETLRDWLGRQSRRHRISVTIDVDTIELERASAGQQQALLDAYIRRHSGGQVR